MSCITTSLYEKDNNFAPTVKRNVYFEEIDNVNDGSSVDIAYFDGKLEWESKISRTKTIWKKSWVDNWS